MIIYKLSIDQAEFFHSKYLDDLSILINNLYGHSHDIYTLWLKDSSHFKLKDQTNLIIDISCNIFDQVRSIHRFETLHNFNFQFFFFNSSFIFVWQYYHKMITINPTHQDVNDLKYHAMMILQIFSIVNIEFPHGVF